MLSAASWWMVIWEKRVWWWAQLWEEHSITLFIKIWLHIKALFSNGSWVKSMTQTSVDGVGGVLAPRWDSDLQSWRRRSRMFIHPCWYQAIILKSIFQSPLRCGRPQIYSPLNLYNLKCPGGGDSSGHKCFSKHSHDAFMVPSAVGDIIEYNFKLFM